MAWNSQPPLTSLWDEDGNANTVDYPQVIVGTCVAAIADAEAGVFTTKDGEVVGDPIAIVQNYEEQLGPAVIIECEWVLENMRHQRQ